MRIEIRRAARFCWDLLIRGDQQLETGRFSRCEQYAVLQAGKLRIPRRLAIVSGKLEPQPLIDTLVQQDLHEE